MSLKLVSDALSVIMFSGIVVAGILVIYIWIKNRTLKISVLRTFVQIVSLYAIFTTILILAKWNSLVFAVIVLVLPIFIGRFFCGWLCPFGLYQDLISLLRKRLRIRYWTIPDRANKALHKLRYILAASMLSLPFIYGALDLQSWSDFIQFQGNFKPLIIYFLGPLEPLLIPYPGDIQFLGYSLSYPYIRGFTQYFEASIFVTIAVILFIVFTASGAFMTRRFWCRFCPTGVSIAAINRFKGVRGIPVVHLNKSEEKCTKCGICKRVCPVQVTDVYDVKGGDVSTQMCMLCLRCVEMCPYEGCLTVKAANKTLAQSRNWLEPSESE